MEYLSSGNRYASLSLADLLTAREQFHAHLIHKRHVIGTAVGRYLIRKNDPFPSREDGLVPERTEPKPPRTLETSEIREYSWPCVLVFVDRWVDESEFGKGELATSDYVPKTIYMPDGKAVPICLVLATPAGSPPKPQAPPLLDSTRLQGGHAVVIESQNMSYRATVGCLLSDGRKIYALTARHVAGAEGSRVLAEDQSPIGTASSLQLSRVPFESVYAPWPGKHAFVNLDVALVEVEDITKWSSGIESIGAIGPLAALSTYNLSLNLIGCPVRSHGAASGPMKGRIAALFYRYKSVGGFDYVADFLIGSRHDQPLATRPGDSGAAWVVDSESEDDRNRPIAVQWGGTVLGGLDQQTTFALASNLSTICRELDVDVYRGPSVAAFEYWGYDGHKAIGQLAAHQVRHAKLRTLLTRNSTNLGALANVPDTMWKKGQYRRSKEGPNHYADVDLSRPGIANLADQTPDAASIDPEVWRTYYEQINHHPQVDGKVSPGLLPFRIAQVFRELIAIVESGNTEDIVAAMGVLAHYDGDSCQPLHSTYLTDGNPFKRPSGSPTSKMLGLGKGWGGGVHSAYETDMISANLGDLRSLVQEELSHPHPHPPILRTGREAAWEALELMRRSRENIDPMELVEFYAAHMGAADIDAQLWNEFGTRTVKTMVDGCRVLAWLWDSAWELGNGDAIPDGELTKKEGWRVKEICQPETFLPSLSLEDIGADVLD